MLYFDQTGPTIEASEKRIYMGEYIKSKSNGTLGFLAGVMVAITAIGVVTWMADFDDDDNSESTYTIPVQYTDREYLPLPTATLVDSQRVISTGSGSSSYQISDIYSEYNIMVSCYGELSGFANRLSGDCRVTNGPNVPTFLPSNCIEDPESGTKLPFTMVDGKSVDVTYFICKY
jgi:hypothetical protein